MSTINELIHDEPTTKMQAAQTTGDSTPDEPGWTPPDTDPGPDR